MNMNAVNVRFPVSSLRHSLRWYKDVLDRGPTKTRRGAAAWNFEGGSWFVIIEDAANAGRGRMTFLVPDLYARLNHLHLVGLTVIGTTTDQLALLTVRDPDGNRLSFGQPLPLRSGRLLSAFQLALPRPSGM